MRYHKKEREEFIVVKATPDDYGYDANDGGKFDRERFNSPEGSIKPLSSFLKGIYVNTYIARTGKSFYPSESMEQILSHPKLKGYFLSPTYKNRDRKIKILPLGTDLSAIEDD